MKIRILLSILIVILSIQANGQSSHKIVLELMEKSGSTAQLKQFDDILSAKIAEKKSSFPNEEDFKKFVSIMKSGINSKDAEKYFVEYFELNSNEDSIKKVISLYNSPFMIEFTKMELVSSDPSKQQEQILFFQSLQGNPPSQARIQQLVLLNNELGSSEVIFKMFRNIAISMAKGLNSVQPKDKQISLVEIEQNMKSTFTADFTQQMTNQIIALSLYTYKSVDDAKLNEYIKVWQSPIGQYFIKETFGALDYSFSNMFENVGSSFKILEKDK